MTADSPQQQQQQHPLEQQQQQQQQQQRQLGTEVAEPHWVPGFVLACDPVALSQSSEEVQQRAAAVRLLISFMGSAQGWLYSAWDFVSECTVCYGRGWTADGVYGHLQDEEFAQSGGLAISVARLPGTANVTAAVFARWLSIVYMTLAQTGVEFPGASRHDGWAWVSGAAHMQAEEESSSTMEAYGLADFVLHTIRNEEQKEQAGRSGDIGRDPGQAADPAVEGVLARITMDQPQLQQQARAGFVRLDDPQLVPTSPSVVLMSQQISLVQMARQLVLQERAQATAAAPPAAA